MASLDKLAIRGIRSFDDKTISVIEFFSPVTVIVGHNGSGKTTIIECLKYATTGDQPPNTRGGAFVHDPKMANEKEVKAQVKLRFHAANGTRMLAVRNLSVTAKKTSGLTMKTLEGILALADTNVEKGGKRGVISTKCAELDTEIPQLLGVSKSVLENVIFCHQEDSYWPLAEPSILKKKFDDIFEATKYTKALDNIKVLRKERVADLKAEKEHLEGLRREKGHADKLRKALSDLQSTIAAKEVEYDDTTKLYNDLTVANNKFYEYASKFREKFQEIERCEENIKLFDSQMKEAKMNLQSEIPGSEEQLKKERDNMAHVLDLRKEKLAEENGRLNDLEETIGSLRQQRQELIQLQTRLTTFINQQASRIEERDQLVAELGDKHGIRGFNVAPLDSSKYLEFRSRLEDLSMKQKATVQAYKREEKTKQDDYNNKRLKLSSEAEKHKAEASSSRQRISEFQQKIKVSEAEAEKMDAHSLDLDTLRGDIDEKRQRSDKLKSSIDAAKYDEQIGDRSARIQDLERKREAVNGEMKALSSQGSSRAKLELKRGEIRTKGADIKHTVENINAKYRAITKKDVKVETVVSDVDDLLERSESQLAESETKASALNSTLQHAQANLSTFQGQLKTKQAELRTGEKDLAAQTDGKPLEEQLRDAGEQLDVLNSQKGLWKAFNQLFKKGSETHTCTLCNRGMDDEAFKFYQDYCQKMMKRASPESYEEHMREIEGWTEELARLQELMPLQKKIEDLKTHEISTLETQVKKLNEEIAEGARKAQEADDAVSSLKKQIRDVQTLQASSRNIARLQKETQRLNEEIESLVNELSASGSTKTVDDVQTELDEISAQIQGLDKERTNLSKEKDRQTKLLHTIESDTHKMQLEERDLQAKIKEREDLITRVESMKKDIVIHTQHAKDADAQLREAQAPIEALREDFDVTQKALTSQINEAQSLAESLAQSVDKLNMAHQEIEKNARLGYPAKLRKCEEQLAHAEEQVHECDTGIAEARKTVSGIERDVAGADAKRANLQENIRVRQYARQIEETQKKIDEFDMEEASRARRNFEEKYSIEKEKETKLHASCSHLQGEITSLQSQLKNSQKDMKEFKDIDQKYTDQLIKVKMSDVANNDLELYSKALDNAIMKYHGLKMEEVNTTMRHLWNRTYQGTDIDGIKIRSDVEGGASKRSYNYRVVMTKDQVEMDMRGRCSAGQKMLASIIIRLALSDSFGQNCGILALDEPTNALDRENIDALAASLVDIIEERKDQSNFQLIIITHDETFLAKLGQNNIMQHYWRVSRDARQKSIIERQNFST